MSEATQIIISIQGKPGCGKTQLAEQAIKPAIAAVGGTVAKEVDAKSGVILTVSLPAGSLPPREPGAMARVFSQAAYLAASDYAREGAPRIGFKNWQLVRSLLESRASLAEYASSNSDMAGTVVRMSLPQAIKENIQAEALIALLHGCAASSIDKIDAELARLGFDITDEK